MGSLAKQGIEALVPSRSFTFTMIISWWGELITTGGLAFFSLCPSFSFRAFFFSGPSTSVLFVSNADTASGGVRALARGGSRSR